MLSSKIHGFTRQVKVMYEIYFLFSSNVVQSYERHVLASGRSADIDNYICALRDMGLHLSRGQGNAPINYVGGATSLIVANFVASMLRERPCTPRGLCNVSNRHGDQDMVMDSTDNNDSCYDDRISWGEFCVLASELYIQEHLISTDVAG